VLSRRYRPVPLLGVVVTAAALIPYLGVEAFEPGFPIGIAATVVGGEILERRGMVGLPVLLAGIAAVVFDPMFVDTAWVVAGTVAFIVVAGWGLARLDDALGHTGVPALMMAGSIFGVWAAVPDTEFASILLGAMAATVLTAWPRALAEIGPGGAAGVATMMAIAIAMGGEQRPGSVAGAWFTVGAAILVPVVVKFLSTSSRGAFARRRWWIFGIHAVLVLVTSRVAAHQELPEMALAIAIPTMVVGLLAVWWLATGDGPREKPRPSVATSDRSQ
jgi:hypothetical protein